MTKPKPIIGRIIRVLVTDVYAQGGEVIGIPVNPKDMEQAAREGTQKIVDRFNNWRPPTT